MSKPLANERSSRQRQSTPEWYTQPWLLQRIADFYGGSYFDPCPASGGVITENGLYGSWKGLQVYCNPPYGAAIKPWVVKAMTEPVRECILLVPSYTETAWFAPMYSHTICFIARRVQFIRGERGLPQKIAPSPYGSALVYRGRRYRKFADAFCDLGPIVRTYQPKRDPRPALLSDGAAS